MVAAIQYAYFLGGFLVSSFFRISTQIGHISHILSSLEPFPQQEQSFFCFTYMEFTQDGQKMMRVRICSTLGWLGVNH